jgi:hypothetical protein
MTGQAGTYSQKRAAPLLRGLYERCAFGVALAVFGVGGLIYTAHEYSDFTFECEVKIEEPMDSGIFLNMVPGLRGYQVTIDTPKDGELGGIYAGVHLPSGNCGHAIGSTNNQRGRIPHRGCDFRKPKWRQLIDSILRDLGELGLSGAISLRLARAGDQCGRSGRGHRRGCGTPPGSPGAGKA